GVFDGHLLYPASAKRAVSRSRRDLLLSRARGDVLHPRGHQPAYALRHEPDGPALRGADGQRVFSHIYGGRFAVCLVDSAPFAQCARLWAGPDVTGPFLMFERRLLMLLWASVCAGLILVARLFQLQVLEGSDCRRLAEAALTRQQQYLAPVRG